MNKPSPEKKIKLSPAMKTAIRRMRVGNPCNTFFDVNNAWWIVDGYSHTDKTMGALMWRNLIQPGELSHGLRYYTLTELGKTISL